MLKKIMLLIFLFSMNALRAATVNRSGSKSSVQSLNNTLVVKPSIVASSNDLCSFGNVVLGNLSLGQLEDYFALYYSLVTVKAVELREPLFRVRKKVSSYAAISEMSFCVERFESLWTEISQVDKNDLSGQELREKILEYIEVFQKVETQLDTLKSEFDQFVVDQVKLKKL